MGSTPDSHEMNGLTVGNGNGDATPPDEGEPLTMFDTFFGHGYMFPICLQIQFKVLMFTPFTARRQWLRTHRQININHYANKKSAAESMLDIALLMANASQLKAVMEQGPSFSFYVPLIVLISISLALQVGVGVLLIFLVKYDLNNPAKHARLDFLNNLATGLVFVIVVVNIFITAFGVQKPSPADHKG